MELADLRTRVEQGENLHTEFKVGPIRPDDLAAALVAFANTDGGNLILGVSDAREILGTGDGDRIAREVDNVAVNNCEPPITVLQETVRTEDDRTIVVVRIPKGDMRPYRTNRGAYYVRTSSGRRQASREELLRLFQATESLYYDETPLSRLTLQDLDLAAFDSYLQDTGQSYLRGDDPKRLLANWYLTANEHPTIAGILLFGRKPQQHLPYAQINAARFAGTDSSFDPVDRKDLGGRLLEVIDQAERFLDLHLPVPHEIRGFQPEPRPELPKEVLREAIVNAVAHRDYTIRGPIRLFVFDDRIEIHTPGRPPNSVDAEAMRSGAHVVRNPWLYARLSDAGLVTRAGTGIRRIVRLVREATGREVGIEVREFEVLLTLPRPTARSNG
ncbi:MAG TPA: RNA-binding domain-containing protein [Thermoanaerobaculia bacterium]|jgi:ATP-dependent DNA helicase RecG|nr:RNA-binding domain-containing protein [Thermoanaerobaculia bacterium]